MDWESVFAAYPVNQEFVWLNNCGTTPAGSHIVDAVSCFINKYSEKGILADTPSYLEVKERIKEIIADLLNCRSEELSLIHNTSEGMNFISHGLDLAPADEIILLENEYPSNVYPWLHWKEKGIRIITAPMENNPELFFRSLSRLINDRTRVISISAVHWCTGMPLPLEQVGILCKEKRIELVVDGAQGVGMQPIDLKRTGVDYMAFSAWKWLMGPLGLGMLYVSRKKLDVLKPIFIGTESVVNDEEYLPYKSQLKPSADRFTFSTSSFIDWIYFKSALEFLSKIGFEKIRKRIFYLTDHLNKRLRQLGFHIFSDRFSKYPTGITVCEKPGLSTKRIMGSLKKNRIVAAERLGRIRFSPHIYNSISQLDKAVEVLANE